MNDLIITEWLSVSRESNHIGDINRTAGGGYVFDAEPNTWVLDLTSPELRAIADKLDELNGVKP